MGDRLKGLDQVQQSLPIVQTSEGGSLGSLGSEGALLEPFSNTLKFLQMSDI